MSTAQSLVFFILIVGSARGAEPVAARVESSVASKSPQIRQLAMDGDGESFFETARDATAADHFTAVFDRPVDLSSVSAVSGRPDGSGAIDSGSIEVSADGVAFEPIAEFSGGKASAAADRKGIKAVRLRPTADLKHPMAIREIKVESSPPVAPFAHPIEFQVVVDDAPEMRDWAEGVARLCEAYYPTIVDMLDSEGDRPAREVTMILSSKYDGVAMAGGGRITGSVKYFKARPEDRGAMIHETVHIVQRYRGRRNPGWLVEGVADYVRFFKYEPDKIGPIDARRARYNDSYRTSARFLAYLADKYDPRIVNTLNAAMREGKYRRDLFKELTGKPLAELDEEWRATLQK